ncbi:hypothetical protein [Paludisphaera mucosa]|uniref:Uncharacterized protein n=1 Tax=Paludisphaera mucosa TaxID=3030827 RepID=A0ABT6FKW9_9BACT|nr:hypothetical protein [Paludisphaera mucosa]MDG3008228.1 hypothetical protein [Paludisphaera mucosa]
MRTQGRGHGTLADDESKPEKGEPRKVARTGEALVDAGKLKEAAARLTE